MGNIVTHTNVKKDTFTSLNGELLQYYDKQTDTYKPFEPGNKYYLQYIISHDESGRNTGLKTYPTPFYIKPLLGVSYANIRIVRNDMNLYNIFIEDLRYSHPMYKNSVLKCYVISRYSFNYTTTGFKGWYIDRNFDENNQVGWEQIDEDYLDYYFTIEVQLQDQNRNLLWSFKTLRIHIDPLINDGMVDRVTQVYPEVITNPALAIIDLDFKLFSTGAINNTDPFYELIISNIEFSHPMYQHTPFHTRVIVQYFANESDTTPVATDTFTNYYIDFNMNYQNTQYFTSSLGQASYSYYMRMFYDIVDTETQLTKYYSFQGSKILIPFMVGSMDNRYQLYPPTTS